MTAETQRIFLTLTNDLAPHVVWRRDAPLPMQEWIRSEAIHGDLIKDASTRDYMIQISGPLANLNNVPRLYTPLEGGPGQLISLTKKPECGMPFSSAEAPTLYPKTIPWWNQSVEFPAIQAQTLGYAPQKELQAMRKLSSNSSTTLMTTVRRIIQTRRTTTNTHSSEGSLTTISNSSKHTEKPGTIAC